MRKPKVGERRAENVFEPLEAPCIRVFKGLSAHNSSRSKGKGHEVKVTVTLSGDTSPPKAQKPLQHDSVSHF